MIERLEVEVEGNSRDQMLNEADSIADAYYGATPREVERIHTATVSSSVKSDITTVRSTFMVTVVYRTVYGKAEAPVITHLAP